MDPISDVEPIKNYKYVCAFREFNGVGNDRARMYKKLLQWSNEKDKGLIKHLRIH